MRPHPPKIAALIALHEGALGADGTRRIEAHLRSCHSCREAHRAIEEYDALASSIRNEELPTIDWSKMEAEVRSRTSPRARSSPARWRRAAPVLLATAAALLWIWRPTDPAAPEAGDDAAPNVAKVDARDIGVEPLSARVELVVGEVIGEREREAPRRVMIDDVLSEGTRLRAQRAAQVDFGYPGETRFALVSREGADLHVERAKTDGITLELLAGSVRALASNTRVHILAAAHRIEASISRFDVVMEDESSLSVVVHRGEVRLVLPDGTELVLAAPVTWSNRSGLAQGAEPETPIAAPSDEPTLRVHHPEAVRFEVGARTFAGEEELQLRAPEGEISIGVIDSRGRSFRTVATVGPLGLGLSERELHPVEVARGREGTLDPDDIERVVRTGLPRLRQCYERALRIAPDVGGRAQMRVTVRSDGSVARAAIADATFPPELEACIEERAAQWSFPPPVGGSVTFEVPLRFGLQSR